MSTRIRQRFSGDRRRGSLKNLVRTRVGGVAQSVTALSLQSIGRHLLLVGPQDPVGFEDSFWTYGASNPNGEIGWRVMFDHAAAPTYVTPAAPNNHWVRKMQPMRFRIDSLLDSFSGFGYSNIRALFENDVSNIGHSAFTPSEQSHLQDLQVTSASFPLRGIWHNAYSTSSGWSTDPYVTHYRILVDGIDATGVVNFSSPLPLSINTNTGVPRIFTGLPTGYLPFIASPGQTVEIDFWVYIDTAGGPFEGAGLEWPVCRTDDVCAFTGAELRANVRKLRGTYQLTFPSGGPQPTITLTEQPGWTYSSSATSHTIENAEWSLTLDWSSEYARLDIVQNSKYDVPTGASSRMRYLPSDSAHYDGVEFENGYIAKPGVWNSQGLTVFALRQRQVQPGVYSSLNATEYGAWLSNSFFSDFPSAVIVERL